MPPDCFLWIGREEKHGQLLQIRPETDIIRLYIGHNALLRKAVSSPMLLACLRDGLG